MVDQWDKGVFGGDWSAFALAQALEHFGYVTQVEHLNAFPRNGQEYGCDFLLRLKYDLTTLIQALHNLSCESWLEVSDDCVEDQLHGFLGHPAPLDDVEESGEARA